MPGKCDIVTIYTDEGGGMLTKFSVKENIIEIQWVSIIFCFEKEKSVGSRSGRRAVARF